MSTRLLAVLVPGLAALALASCGSKTTSGPGTGGTGSSGSTSASGASSHGGSSQGGSSQGGSSPGGASISSSTAANSTSAASTGSAQSGSGGGDPFEANRAACIAKINALRATKSLPPYGRWNAAESCVDQQATSDEKTNSPHGAWKSGTYTCNGSGQNECLGAGAAGIESCLDSMWAEKDQPGCSGCDACDTAYNPSCPNCDFYGQTTGNVCGHYVNMSAKYFTEAACGFSSLGGWDAINFH